VQSSTEGTRLRCYSTSQKVAGSSADEVILFFFFFFCNLPYPPSRTIALEFTQPLTKMNTRKKVWGVEHGRRVRLDNVQNCDSYLNMLSSQSLFVCLFVHICLYSLHTCFVGFVAYPNHMHIQIIVKTK
jgi:hypothetical protein